MSTVSIREGKRLFEVQFLHLPDRSARGYLSWAVVTGDGTPHLEPGQGWRGRETPFEALRIDHGQFHST